MGAEISTPDTVGAAGAGASAALGAAGAGAAAGAAATGAGAAATAHNIQLLTIVLTTRRTSLGVRNWHGKQQSRDIKLEAIMITLLWFGRDCFTGD